MLLPVQLDQQEMKAVLEIVLTIKWAYVLMFSEALYDLTYSTSSLTVEQTAFKRSMQTFAKKVYQTEHYFFF